MRDWLIKAAVVWLGVVAAVYAIEELRARRCAHAIVNSEVGSGDDDWDLRETRVKCVGPR
ncbi:MAG TPA: hypothetical protein VFT98_04890 [Myxococcota bacterium]|nr:hypothetical protein [Myxococcota bacterium]